MATQITLSTSNPEWIEKFKSELPQEIQTYLERMRAQLWQNLTWGRSTVNFQEMIGDIDFIFQTQETGFENNWVINEAGENLWSLKILAIAIILGFNTQQALRMFWEHYEEVIDNPEWDSHSNIRALMDQVSTGINWVIIHWIPFSPKSHQI